MKYQGVERFRRKKPPKIIKGIIIGAAKALAASRFGAIAETFVRLIKLKNVD